MVTLPTIKLVGPSVVTLTKGTVYNACPAGLTSAAVCDRGVIAQDAGGASLLANVTACVENALPGAPGVSLVRSLQQHCCSTRPGSGGRLEAG
jgi:hypothetical protein